MQSGPNTVADRAARPVGSPLRLGTIGTLKAIPRLFVHVRRWYLIERRIALDLPPVDTRPSLRWRLADLPDLEALASLRAPAPTYSARFRTRFGRGQDCVACFDDETVAGYFWMSTIKEFEPRAGYMIRPRQDESYGFDLFVRPAYRRSRVGSQLVIRFLHHAREAGRSKAIAMVEVTNLASLAMFASLGFRPTCLLTSVQLCRGQGILLARLDPFPELR
jgi:ribosomal protein S18 acetylase RimI-like enzyme